MPTIDPDSLADLSVEQLQEKHFDLFSKWEKESEASGRSLGVCEQCQTRPAKAGTCSICLEIDMGTLNSAIGKRDGAKRSGFRPVDKLEQEMDEEADDEEVDEDTEPEEEPTPPTPPKIGKPAARRGTAVAKQGDWIDCPECGLRKKLQARGKCGPCYLKELKAEKGEHNADVKIVEPPKKKSASAVSPENRAIPPPVAKPPVAGFDRSLDRMPDNAVVKAIFYGPFSGEMLMDVWDDLEKYEALLSAKYEGELARLNGRRLKIGEALDGYFKDDDTRYRLIEAACEDVRARIEKARELGFFRG